MNTDLMFSKASDEWSTPEATFRALDDEFHFTLDAAATLANRKVENYRGPDHEEPMLRDALQYPWHGVVWLNPPYSKVREFITKAAGEAKAGHATVVCLVPSRTDTRWWHDHVWEGDHPREGVEVRFLKGRLKFGGSANSAPFPSVVLVFRRA